MFLEYNLDGVEVELSWQIQYRIVFIVKLAVLLSVFIIAFEQIEVIVPM